MIRYLLGKKLSLIIAMRRFTQFMFMRPFSPLSMKRIIKIRII